MHSAPTVVFPAGRCRFAWQLVGVLWLAGLVAMLLWVFQPGSLGWRQALGLAGLAMAGALALHGWWVSPAGDLSWDGQYWVWSERNGRSQGTVTPCLDVQHCILLRFRGTSHRPRWLWLERRSRAERWDDLRRAVYSRAGTAQAAASGPL